MRGFISAAIVAAILLLSGVVPAGAAPLAAGAGAPPLQAASPPAPAPEPPPEPSIVLLVDQSGSLGDADVASEKAAVELLAASESATNARVAVVGFGSSNGSGQNAVDVLCPAAALTDPPARQRVVDCSRALHKRSPAEGNDTDYAAALKAALEQLKSDAGPGIVFLLTDGKLDVGNSPQYGPDAASRTSEARRQLTDEVLPAAKKAGVQVWPIGFGQIDAPTLDVLAAGGAGPNPACATSSRPRPVVAADSTTLARQFLEVLGSARCNRTTSSPPKDITAGGTAELAVEIPKIATGGTISVFRANPRISVTYLDPKGREVPLDGELDGSAFAHTKGDTVDGLRITEPEPGKWTARLVAPAGVSAPLVQASISWKGALRTAIDVRPLIPSPGDGVDARVRLQTRRGVTVDPGQVTDLAFGLTVSGQGFEPLHLPLTIDPKEPTVAVGNFTLPKEASGVVDVIGEVDGLGVETDRRPYSFRIGTPQDRLALVVPDRRLSLRRGETASLTVETDAGRPRALRVATKAFDATTQVSVAPTALEVPLGPGKQQLKVTVAKDSAFGPQSIELVFLDEGGSNQIGTSVLFFTVEREPSALSRIFPYLVGLIVLIALGAVALVLGRRALAPPPVSGLVAHLVDPEGSTTDGMESPYGQCEAPLGKVQEFAFIVESTEYTRALISASPSEPEAITVARTRSGPLRVKQPNQPHVTVDLGTVVTLGGQDGFGLVIVGSAGQPGPYPGWQQKVSHHAPDPDGVPPPQDPEPTMDSGGYVPAVTQSDQDLL